MPFFLEHALRITWLAVLGYWLWAARSAKPAQQQESGAKRLLMYWLPLIFAALLLGPSEWFAGNILREQFVPHSTLVYSVGLALCVSGATLAILSRVMLGRNWSATVQLKQEHELITHGPYRWVRHPIYTGFLLLFLGNAFMVGDWRGLLAVAIVLISFWRKLRLEETWLAAHFGQVYRDYQSHTKALIPGVL
ncbi:protein-S-isoprenylcysteine O-methyltransferase Ste14 [Luteibacter sp. Sphag1AF]|uniref:methyltransferase family protein n=1 Tax=Luteibacter sp. Sphag1AF TaxID=2587031 RepID=UPI001617E11D|nr:isoprenylcysteine carboxylmethyltransferase family protein [Luteibacter sp. Sphag1AF]MBB3226874.1 protein-S-isoprenylcysteine O-methyltransferase Ste14 [Luteibacter sp. Sphag1AF]